ncbi:MAG: 3-oxoacyl-[acyl-carrier-protein] synthase III C-terminal domain-containing protein [Acidobacteriota bacterium]
MHEKNQPTLSLPSVGMQSLAVSVPDRVVTNEHWRQNQPKLVSEAEKRIWMWKKPANWDEGGSIAFNREMEPFLDDPFRGARERRLLEPGGTALSLEADASRKAMEAAGVGPEDIDLLLLTSFLPDIHGIGGSAYLARELGAKGAAWNMESACSSANLAFLTATQMIRAGQFKRALVVTSCTYSRVTVDSDPISWTVGDGATAAVVGHVEEGRGFLGAHSIHSGNTCGAVEYYLDVDEDGNASHRMRTGKLAGKLLRETSEPNLKACVSNALDQAGLGVDDIDFAVFNTPLAWYAPFCARALGIDREKTINLYPFYNNVGPCLTFTNLFHAAHWNLKPDDNVLFYSVGSVSSCAAIIVRWGDIGLGPIPEGISKEAYDEVMRTFPRPVEAAAEAVA